MQQRICREAAEVHSLGGGSLLGTEELPNTNAKQMEEDSGDPLASNKNEVDGNV